MKSAMSSPRSYKFTIATEPFILLHYFSFGSYSSLVPQLTVDKVCHGIYNSTVCGKLSGGLFPHQQKIVYEQATMWNSVIFAAVCIPSSLTILLIGALSDFVSKKKLLLLNPVAMTIQTVILILSSYLMSSSMGWVALAASLPSLYGDVHGTKMLAHSYMADVTEANEKRTFRMCILEGLKFLSTGVGSFLSGILLQSYNYYVAFSLSLAVSVTNLVFVAFVLPETKVKDSPKDEGEVANNVCSHLKITSRSIINFVNKYLFSWKNKLVGLLLVSIFFTNSAAMGEVAVLVLFLKHKPLHLSGGQIGEFLLFAQFTRCSGVIIIAIICLKLIKPPDICLIMIGQLSMISIYIGIGLSQEWQTLLGVVPLTLASPLAIAGFRSMLTKLVEPFEHGIVLSFFALISLIAKVLATFGCDYVLNETAETFPGWTIILLAFLCLPGLLLASIVFFIIRRDANKTLENQNEEAYLLDSNNFVAK